MSKLKAKVALATGSGRGIGRAIALKLASERARVVVNDLDAAPGDAVAAEIKAAGGEAVAVNGSVSEPGFADRFVGAAMEKFGGLDIIVNKAGYTWDSTIRKMTDEQFQAMLDVHLVAPFRILRAAAEPIRIMAKKEAEAGREVFRKVVNISSIAGLYGNAGQASYLLSAMAQLPPVPIHSRNKLATASGFSIGGRWPQSGIMWSWALRIPSRIISDSAKGVITSCAPTITIVGTSIVGRIWR